MADVLVVDDEPSIRKLINIILSSDGHDVREAGNGVEALAEVERTMPDLIVLDLAMPQMGGWRFLEELHARGLRRRTRVVIVSGNFDPRGLTTEQERSASHFLAKPFHPQTLTTLVNDALAQEPDDLYVRKEHSHDLQRLIEKVDRTLG